MHFIKVKSCRFVREKECYKFCQKAMKELLEEPIVRGSFCFWFRLLVVLLLGHDEMPLRVASMTT